MTVKVGRIIRVVTGGDVMRAGNGSVEARVRPRLPCGDVETSTFVRFIALVLSLPGADIQAFSYQSLVVQRSNFVVVVV